MFGIKEMGHLIGVIVHVADLAKFSGYLKILMFGFLLCEHDLF